MMHRKAESAYADSALWFAPGLDGLSPHARWKTVLAQGSPQDQTVIHRQWNQAYAARTPRP
jgi:hypothetical protein